MDKLLELCGPASGYDYDVAEILALRISEFVESIGVLLSDAIDWR
jgi:hypothetical protein